MVNIKYGRLWLAVFGFREWPHWFTIRNRSGLHGYRFWWHVGPLQVRWGRHAKPCERCLPLRWRLVSLALEEMENIYG